MRGKEWWRVNLYLLRGGFNHYLWALLFMKIYPANETEMCTLLGGIDPKTMRKWVWLFIRSISGLSDTVVGSFVLLVVYSFRLI